jgi:hypothetical protein
MNPSNDKLKELKSLIVRTPQKKIVMIQKLNLVNPSQSSI